MAEFYHEVLWQGVGELSEPYLLWNNSVPLDLASPTTTENNFDYSRREYLPFGMQHPRLSLGLCGLVQETLAAPIGGNSPDQGKLDSHGIISSFGERKFLYHRRATFRSFPMTKPVITQDTNRYQMKDMDIIFLLIRILL